MPKVIPEYKEEARRRIIETALDVFMKKGYRATKMEDIARGVGVSKGAIYTYFTGKEDLFVQAAEYSRKKYEVDFLEKSRNNPEIDVFDALFQTVETTLEDGVTLSLELMYLSITNDTLRNFLQEDARKDTDILLRFLIQMQQDGRIQPDADCRELTRLVTTLLYGLWIQVFFGYPADEAQEIWNAAVAPYRVRE
jgi:AcrR family transcriptional regulator